jgi:hypothetical protein
LIPDCSRNKASQAKVEATKLDSERGTITDRQLQQLVADHTSRIPTLQPEEPLYSCQSLNLKSQHQNDCSFVANPRRSIWSQMTERFGSSQPVAHIPVQYSRSDNENCHFLRQEEWYRVT